MKKNVFFKLIITVCIFIFIFQKINMDFFKNIDLKNLKFIFFFLLVTASASADNLVISVYKWRKILKFYNIHIPFCELVKIYLKGMFFNNFLFGFFGGDYYKFHQISRYGFKKTNIFSSVFIDRFSGITAMFCISVVATLVFRKTPPIDRHFSFLMYFYVMFAGVMVVLLFPELFNKPLSLLKFTFLTSVKEKIVDMNISLKKALSNKSLLTEVILLSFLFQIVLIFNNYLLGVAVGINTASLPVFIALIPVALLLSYIPLTIGGLGLREGAYIYFLSHSALISRSQAFSISILAYLIGVLISIFGGILYLKEK